MDFNDEYKKIFNFHGRIPNRLNSRESGWLEFKESFNWSSKSKYSKSMAAFANNRGGFIIFGVKNNPRDLVGLQNNNFEDTDEAKLSEYLNSVFSPEINFDKFTATVKRNKIGILHIYQSNNKPIICIKSDLDVKEAEIYYRYNARSEKIKYPELIKLIEYIKEKERKEWMEHIERISKIGSSNAAVLDTIKGDIKGRGGTLVIDKKLLPKLKFIKEGNLKERGFPTLRLIGDVKPVIMTGYKTFADKEIAPKFRISDNPNAPEVRISEKDIFEKYPYDFKSLISLLRKRYKNFLMNNECLKLRRLLEGYPKFCIIRRLNPKNPKSSSQKFYSEEIIKEFDKHYSKVEE